MSDRLLLLSARDEDRLEKAFARSYLLLCTKYNRVEQYIDDGRRQMDTGCMGLASLQLCYSEGQLRETLEGVEKCMAMIDKLPADDSRKQSCAPHVAELREVIDELRAVLMITETLHEARAMKAAITPESVSNDHDRYVILQTINFTIRGIEGCSIHELLDDPEYHEHLEIELTNLYLNYEDRYVVIKQLRQQFRP